MSASATGQMGIFPKLSTVWKREVENFLKSYQEGSLEFARSWFVRRSSELGVLLANSERSTLVCKAAEPS